MVASSNAVAIQEIARRKVSSGPLILRKMRKKKSKIKIKIEKHMLVPVHKKLSNDEKKKILEKYNITFKELPNISADDSAILGLDAKEGDVIKIIRKSPTTGETIFYRGVVDV